MLVSTRSTRSRRVLSTIPLLFLLFLILAAPPPAAAQQICQRVVRADVVAFDQVFFWNRLGAVQPQGMIYALRHDVVSINGGPLAPGNVQLRRDKRPRPLVLRMNVGDCLVVDFQNFLNPTPVDQEQPATRHASFHPIGLQLVTSIADDASFVGTNPSSLAAVNEQRTYTFYAEREGEHTVFSAGATNGGEGDGGSTNSGLFGAVIVEPVGARWYRSQLTRADLDLVTTGTTIYGQPTIDYEKRYPPGHPRAGLPILNMLDGGKIIHSDLTAIIAGPNADGTFPTNTFPPNPTVPRRHHPFREFTIMYHDEIGAVQAFPEFEQNELAFTLHGGRDGFALNYGAGGIGAEILANRFRVGPMWDCAECKFEEFFLSSWTVGDPAMVVDRPANIPCGPENPNPNAIGQNPQFPLFVDNLREGVPCTPLPNPKATKAFFPDDPANVYHGYLNDHTKFRVLHGGSKEHHIHHLHAHQWLFTADSDKSTYLDSQAIGPGSSFTAEIAYEGGGNLNKTVGDAIFHCHFYPHFAQGMWALWRVHDVFERGSRLDAEGRPLVGERALPDGEIARGTPIPAVVPLIGRPMAPVPQANVQIVNGQAVITGNGNPGYPFFVPATAGHRPPKPPLDTIHDGGLPRHKILDGTFEEAHTRLDFHKILLTAVAEELPEAGTFYEKKAMDFHALPSHPSCDPSGLCNIPTSFVTNGKPPIAGAPYADPCPVNPQFRCDNAAGDPLGFRCYKAADIQDDVRINKKGWHFPQQRFSALWDDVDDFLRPFGSDKKPPEPLFFRANSEDCIEFWLTNLVPHEYALDDFQVRSPTDILGQHIHLVKFDVTASDGAANGFNYEDGSFAPAEVRERIEAIREENDCTTPDPRDGTFECPLAEFHPFPFFQREEWKGAQTTTQRWWADPIKDLAGNDRTLRTVFTHDHFGPSTHQQAGLYAGLVIEPKNSSWKHNETGAPLGGREDGGPTTWQAIIDPPTEPDYREFLLEFGDFQLAYEEDSAPCRFDPQFGAIRCDDPDDAVNPPGREQVGLPNLLERPDDCPVEDDNVPGPPPPCPEIISADDPGTMSVNYRHEPLALRVKNANANTQAAGEAGDLSFAFASITRSIPQLNVQPTFYDELVFDARPKDPFTPLLRVYENDRVQIRILVGAHEEGHNFSVHGIKWLFEPSEPDSGFKNSQMMGISEHFEFVVPQIIKRPSGDAVDRLWSAGSSTDDYWNGIWGLLRAYTGRRSDLEPLPDNPPGTTELAPGTIGAFEFSCPKAAPVREYKVTAVVAQRALPGGRLVYNSRTDGSFGPLFDPTSILYFRSEDLQLDPATGWLKVKPGVRIEPLILRARAGECVKVTLENAVPAGTGPLFDLNGFNTLPMIVEFFNANQVAPSRHVGLHPQLLYYDVSRFDGANVGVNPVQTVAPTFSRTYEWYAGDVFVHDDGTATATPIEFGATNLISSDRIEHASKGAIGALVIEPANALWNDSTGSRAEVDVALESSPGGPVVLAWREFVLLFQNDVNMRTDQQMQRFCPGPAPGGPPHGFPVENLACIEDPEDSGQKALNYRTEPLWKRMQHAPGTPLETTRTFTDWFDVVSNTKVGDPPDPIPGARPGDPVTPVFTTFPGRPIRFRVVQPGGHSRNEVFALHGHIWDKEPYILKSTKLGHNAFSFWEGARFGHGPSNHFDILIRNGAGGKFSITGDYLFRDQVSTGFDNGLWGLLRVEFDISDPTPPPGEEE